MKTTARFPRNVSRCALMITLALLAFSLAVCAQAQTYTDLANFDGKNGAGSYVPLIQATSIGNPQQQPAVCRDEVVL
jgi:hypothetical protein